MNISDQDYPVNPNDNLSDDILAKEGQRLMEKVWEYGAIGMTREDLIFIARDLCSGEIVTCDEFLSLSNRKRRRGPRWTWKKTP